MERYYIGIDLGGTNVVAGIVTEEGRLVAKASRPTPRGKGDEAIINQMEAVVRQVLAENGMSMEEMAGAGIGTPGVANSDTGYAEYSCNLGFYDTPLGPELSRRLGKEVLVENDANAAALGEFFAGAGKGTDSMVALTLGTGIGGGVIINRRMLTGFNHAGAELGHMVIMQGGRPCNCGRRGCFEAYASATALINITKEHMQKHPESVCWQLVEGNLDRVNGRTPFAAMEQGDETGAAIIAEYTRGLATGLVNVVNIFQPEVVCIGGGVSNAGEALLAPVRAILAEEDYARNCRQRCRLELAQLGNDAGIIGAALLSKLR